MAEAMDAFKKQNGVYPKRVIFLRDGVGESQKDAIMQTEIEQIRAAFNSNPETKETKMLFIMVNKRVKTKLIVDQNGRISNPQPGTVLDHSIVKKDSYEFFLVSQNTRQGVPTPSHYTVLVDDIQADPKLVMTFVYKLCYLYSNYSGSVKIPAPVKYADKLAAHVSDRKANNVHKWHSDSCRLFFL